MDYAWSKTLHIVFVIAWMAGLFILPRIALYYKKAREDGDSGAALVTFGRKLSVFMSIMAVLAMGLGTWLWLGLGVGSGQYWIHAKLTLMLLIIGHHGFCQVLVKQMREDRMKLGTVPLRILAEAPLLILIAIIYLTIAKPF